MISFVKDIGEALLHLAFPHICQSCGSDALGKGHFLCLRCLSSLPKTNFQFLPNNPVEKIFWGRLPLHAATAQYYFTKESVMRDLLHQLKYRKNKDIGRYLGNLMGVGLAQAPRFLSADVLVPLPLYRSKERLRGYNQAAVLCDGMAEILQLPVLNQVIVRNAPTASQTRKGRMDRWLNMEGRFSLTDFAALEGRHVLLVDDVVTTGATLEACGRELLKAANIQLSIATLCFSSR